MFGLPIWSEYNNNEWQKCISKYWLLTFNEDKNYIFRIVCVFLKKNDNFRSFESTLNKNWFKLISISFTHWVIQSRVWQSSCSWHAIHLYWIITSINGKNIQTDISWFKGQSLRFQHWTIDNKHFSSNM